MSKIPETKISDLIAELKALLEKHGDLPVYAFNEYETGTSQRCAYASYDTQDLKYGGKEWIQIHC